MVWFIVSGKTGITALFFLFLIEINIPNKIPNYLTLINMNYVLIYINEIKLARNTTT